MIKPGDWGRVVPYKHSERGVSWAEIYVGDVCCIEKHIAPGLMRVRVWGTGADGGESAVIHTSEFRKNNGKPRSVRRNWRG